MRARSAATADVSSVVLFAAVGRISHGESVALGGLLHTAWPFLLGCGLGLLLSRTRRDPLLWRAGVLVWLSTVAGGLALRTLTGGGAPVSFVLVTTLTLGLLLGGWRAVARLLGRARARRRGRPAPAPSEGVRR